MEASPEAVILRRDEDVFSPRRRIAEATAFLAAGREGVFAFEAFTEALLFLDRRERARLKLAGGEIIDNLIRHAAPLDRGIVAIRAARRGASVYLCFFFKSPTFAAYADRCVDHEPVYDRSARRWHGMGLRMCRNLSTSLHLRAGSRCDRIIIRF